MSNSTSFIPWQNKLSVFDSFPLESRDSNTVKAIRENARRQEAMWFHERNMRSQQDQFDRIRREFESATMAVKTMAGVMNEKAEPRRRTFAGERAPTAREVWSD